jgi:O-antigen/teichoic acid export membrane protein
LAQVVAVAVFFLNARLIISYLGLDVFGFWALNLSLANLITLINFGSGSTMIKLVAGKNHSPEAQGAIINTMSYLIILPYASIILIILAVYWYDNSIFESLLGHEHSFKILLFIILCSILRIIMNSYFGALDAINKLTFRAIISITTGIWSVFFVYLAISELGLWAVVLAQLLQFSLSTVLSRIVISKTLSEPHFARGEGSKESISDILRFGGKLQLSALPNSANDSFIRIFLGSTLGLESLALFDLAYRVAIYGKMIILSYFNPLVRKFTLDANRGAETKGNLLIELGHSFLIIFPAFLLLLAAAPVLSLIFLEGINLQFIVIFCVLIIGWGIGATGIVATLAARANNIIRWNIISQWLILTGSVLGCVLLFLFGGLSLISACILIASVHAACNLFCFVMEWASIGRLSWR